MKMSTHILIGLMMAGVTLVAGEVTIPNSFTAGTAAKASEVNGNFAAVKTAVDGNANDIATNSHDIDGKLTKNITECTAGSSIRKINTDGTVVCEDDTDTDTTYTAGGGIDVSGTTIRRVSGYVSIHASAFSTSDDINDQTQTCVPSYYNGFVFLFLKSSTKSTCKAFAPVSLPDGATVTSLQCFMVKNDGQTTTPSEVDLHSLNAGGASSQMAKVEIPASHNSASVVASTEDTTIQNSTVDNNQYTYFLEYNPPDNTDDDGGAGMKNRIATCKIGYEF